MSDEKFCKICGGTGETMEMTNIYHNCPEYELKLCTNCGGSRYEPPEVKPKRDAPRNGQVLETAVRETVKKLH